MSKTVQTVNKNRPGWVLPVIIGVLAVIVVGAVAVIALGNRPPETPYTPEVTGGPSAVVDQPSVDHGDVQMLETVESAFVIRNVGDQPLIILGEPRVELVQGCCPPRAVVTETTIPPGQESTVSISYTMHDMMGGPHEFRVHVLTTDPDNTEIVLTAFSNWIE